MALRKIQKTKWLEPLLTKTFFGFCSTHPIRRNELSKYCATCNLPVCQYCLSTVIHSRHKIVKIYRHLYRDVIAYAAVEKLFDCSEIQTYVSNKRLVIALRPRENKGKALNQATACDMCGRRLSDPDSYSYCSLCCKVQSLTGKSYDPESPSDDIQNQPEDEEEEACEPSKPKNRRKGTPSRAPFW